MNKTRHSELRAEMMRRGYDGNRLSNAIGITPVTLSSRLCGKSPWSIKEMYAILDLLNLDYDQMHKYFPKNGVQNYECYRALQQDLPRERKYINEV